MSRIDAAFPKLLASLEKRDARHDTPGCYEWTRENGDQVRALVNSVGFIALWVNDVEQVAAKADNFATACAAVEDLMNKETVR